MHKKLPSLRSASLFLQGVIIATFFFGSAGRGLVGNTSVPDIRVSSSPNGRFLIIATPTETAARTVSNAQISKVTFQVLERVPISDSTNSLRSANKFWTQGASGWTVQVSVDDSPSAIRSIGVPFALGSDDGRFLAVVVVSPPMSREMEILRIYKKRGFTSEMVKIVRLADVWTEEQMQPLNKGLLFPQFNSFGATE